MIMVLNPSFGPKHARNAGTAALNRLKKRRQQNESHHPSPKSVGPRNPRASVAVLQLA